MNVNDYLTPKQAAKKLGISASTIYKHIKDSNHKKIGNIYLIHRGEVNAGGSLSSIKPGTGNYDRTIKDKPEPKRVQYVARRNDQTVLVYVDTLRDDGLSYRKIADKLNSMGIANTKGGYWSAQSIFDYEKRYEL